jgi:hypothetical protein
MTAVSRQANLIAASVQHDPRLVGFPVAIIIQILMAVIPMIIKCMAERSASELKSRLSGEYNAATKSYDPKTLRSVTKLVKWQGLAQFHFVSTDAAEAIAQAALDQARTESDAEITVMMNEVEQPMVKMEAVLKP